MYTVLFPREAVVMTTGLIRCCKVWDDHINIPAPGLFMTSAVGLTNCVANCVCVCVCVSVLLQAAVQSEGNLVGGGGG